MKKCPNCKSWIEILNAQWISYLEMCPFCGYWEDIDYYLNPDTDSLEVMSREEALDLGSIEKCPECWQIMELWEKELYWVCIFCSIKKTKSQIF